jgi:hypothetical protein
MQHFLVKLSTKVGTVFQVAWFLWIPLTVVVGIFIGHISLLIPAYIALGALCIAVYVWGQRMRERHIREAPFPRFLRKKLRETYPHFSAKDYDLIERGLRQFFLACSRSKKQFVAMPSKAVDAMWHEFILHTKGYEAWCSMALGYFLHHTPAEVLGKKAKGNDGLRRAWYWACKDEAIDPKMPSRLPLLFALDTKLAIAGGFSYLPDCTDIAAKNAVGGAGGDTFCGTHFSDGSYCSDSSSSGDFGGADGSSSDGGSDGGGGDGGSCGGGGCGGGGD